MEHNLYAPHYAKALSKLVSTWSTSSTDRRNKCIIDLREHLLQCSPSAFANLSVLTLHTLSHLLTRDASYADPKPYWTRHPRFSEPLLLSLLDFLFTCLSPHRHLPPPPASAFEGLFADNSSVIENEEGDKSKSSQQKDVPCLEILRIAFESAPPKPHHFSLAFLVAQLTAIAADEPAISVRRHGLRALAALVDVLDGPLLATFLPGVVSTLSTILSRSPRLHSGLALPALHTLNLLIERTFPFIEDGETSETLNSVADALQALTVGQPAELSEEPSANTVTCPNADPGQATRPSSLRISIDSRWIEQTSEQLRPRLALVTISRTGPRFHTLPSVRLAFVRFVAELLDQRHLPLDELHTALFKFVLLEACTDPFPTVAHEANSALFRFFSRVGTAHFERALLACLRFANFLTGTMPSLSPMQKSEFQAIRKLSSSAEEDFGINLCSGCLFVLLPYNDRRPATLSATDTIIIPLPRIAAFLNRVGIDPFIRLLLALHETQWKPTHVACDSVSIALRNRVLMIAQVMGDIGLLSCVYDALFSFTTKRNSTYSSNVVVCEEGPLTISQPDAPDRDMFSFKKRAQAALLLHAVVKGALHTDYSSNSTSMSDHNYTCQCASEVLEAMGRLFVPSNEHATAEEIHCIDDAVLTLKLGLLQSMTSLIDDLESFIKRHKMRLIGSGVVLAFLINLLRDVSHGEVSIREQALSTLQHVAKIMRCDSERELLMRHLNFILARVIRNLHETWAGDMLQFVIGQDGDDVSREAILLLHRTVKGISDGLAGVSDARALRMLSSMQSVLLTAIAQKGDSNRSLSSNSHTELAIDNNIHAEQRNNLEHKQKLEQAEFGVVHRALMYYCTDNVVREDEAPEEPSVADRNDLFDGSDEENDSRDLFEEVAENALDGTRDLLIGRPWNVRASSLKCATLAVRLLRNRKKLLLPHVAKLLPLLPEQFTSMNEVLNAGDRMIRAMKQRRAERQGVEGNVDDMVHLVNRKGAELPVVSQACLLLSALAECAGSFIRERFVRLIYPKLRPLLRLCQYFPTLLSGETFTYSRRGSDNSGNVPSHGAMAACDACMEAITSIAVRTPIALAPYAGALAKYLAVFFQERYNPESGSNRVVHTNRAMVRYEKERWDRRVNLAKCIIEALVKVNEGDTFCSFLCVDEEGPDVLESGQDDLFDIPIRLVPSTVS